MLQWVVATLDKVKVNTIERTDTLFNFIIANPTTKKSLKKLLLVLWTTHYLSQQVHPGQRWIYIPIWPQIAAKLLPIPLLMKKLWSLKIVLFPWTCSGLCMSLIHRQHPISSFHVLKLLPPLHRNLVIFDLQVKNFPYLKL